MTDRPILFSAPMVLALLDGRKSQTRRLATSPLRKVDVGDRLYVRETFAFVGSSDPGLFITRADYPRCVPAHYENVPAVNEVRWTTPLHMPRRLSRLTLTVTEVRAQQLMDILNFEARAEGVERWRCHSGEYAYRNYLNFDDPFEEDYKWAATGSFQSLWNSLHNKPGERWDDNPEVVALTFTVEQRNIDA